MKKIKLPSGAYQYKVSKDGFSEYHGSLNIESSDIKIGVVLDQHAYSVTINPIPAESLVELQVNGHWLSGGKYKLKPGTYIYRISGNGYEVYEGVVTVRDEDIVLNIPLDGIRHRVIFTSNFSNTVPELEIQGVYITGSIHEVLPGIYKYRVNRPGFTTVRGSVEVLNGDRTIPIIFDEEYRKLTIKTIPEHASVEVQINREWKYGNEFEVPQGLYKVIAELDGYKSASRTAKVIRDDVELIIILQLDSIDSQIIPRLISFNETNGVAISGDKYTAYAWGEDPQVIPEFLNHLITVDIYNDMGIIIDSDLRPYTWNMGFVGAQIENLGSVIDASIGFNGSCSVVLKGGKIHSWGDSGNAPPDFRYRCVEVGIFSAAINQDGHVITWGEDSPPNLTDNEYKLISLSKSKPYGIAITKEGEVEYFGTHKNINMIDSLPEDKENSCVSCGDECCTILKTDGSLKSFGDISDISKYFIDSTPNGNDYVQVKVIENSAIAIKSDGSTRSWGVLGELDEFGGLPALAPSTTNIGYAFAEVHPEFNLSFYIDSEHSSDIEDIDVYVKDRHMNLDGMDHQLPYWNYEYCVRMPYGDIKKHVLLMSDIEIPIKVHKVTINIEPNGIDEEVEIVVDEEYKFDKKEFYMLSGSTIEVNVKAVGYVDFSNTYKIDEKTNIDITLQRMPEVRFKISPDRASYDINLFNGKIFKKVNNTTFILDKHNEYLFTIKTYGTEEYEGSFITDTEDMVIDIEMIELFHVTMSSRPSGANLIFDGDKYALPVWVRGGEYEYGANLEGYETVDGIINITKNTNIPINLFKFPVLKFNITPPNIDGINITFDKYIKEIDDTTFMANRHTEYEYIIFAPGYKNVEGEVDIVTNDVTVDIELEKINLVLDIPDAVNQHWHTLLDSNLVIRYNDSEPYEYEDIVQLTSHNDNVYGLRSNKEIVQLSGTGDVQHEFKALSIYENKFIDEDYNTRRITNGIMELSNNLILPDLKNDGSSNSGDLNINERMIDLRRISSNAGIGIGLSLGGEFTAIRTSDTSYENYFRNMPTGGGFINYSVTMMPGYIGHAALNIDGSVTFWYEEVTHTEFISKTEKYIGDYVKIRISNRGFVLIRRDGTTTRTIGSNNPDGIISRPTEPIGGSIFKRIRVTFDIIPDITAHISVFARYCDRISARVFEVDSHNTYSYSVYADGYEYKVGRIYAGDEDVTITINLKHVSGPIAIAGCLFHSILGTVYNNNDFNIYGTNNGIINNAPNGDISIKNIAFGEHFAVSIKSDGGIYLWGGFYSSYIPEGNDFKQVEAGRVWYIALRNDGSIIGHSWSETTTNNIINGIPSGTGFIKIAAGREHALALRSDGSIASWGIDNYGQVSGTPSGSGFIDIATGAHSSFAIDSNGGIVCWGRNDANQVTGKPVTGTYKKITAGSDAVIAINTDNYMVAWGDSDSIIIRQLPQIKVKDVKLSTNTGILIDMNDSIRIWGNSIPQSKPLPPVRYYTASIESIPEGDIEFNGTPYTGPVELPPGMYSLSVSKPGYVAVNTMVGVTKDRHVVIELEKIIPESVSVGFYFAATLNQDGGVSAWGRNTSGIISKIPSGVQFKQISCGRDHIVGLTESGSIVSWGGDEYGVTSKTPSGIGFKQVSAGWNASVAIRENGSLVQWGQAENSVHPVPHGIGFTQVSAGWWHYTALKEDGTLHSWGYEHEGSVSKTPKGNNFKQVSCGARHGAALTHSGHIYCWGWDNDGVVSNAPTDGGYIHVECGHYHCVAIRSDNTLVSWGIAHNNAQNIPFGEFKEVGLGDRHGSALTFDNKVISWGYDNNGQVTETPNFD